MIDITGLDKAEVLAALYNNSRPFGMGFLHHVSEPMTPDEARVLIDENPRMYFDYVLGRVMKVNLSGDQLDPRLYDRDNGQGAAYAALRDLLYGLKS